MRVGLMQRLSAAGRAAGRVRARLDDSGRLGLAYTSAGLGRIGAGRPVAVRAAVEVLRPPASHPALPPVRPPFPQRSEDEKGRFRTAPVKPASSLPGPACPAENRA